MPEPDEFTTVRDALIRANNGKQRDPLVLVLLDNQREICACLATIARGGTLPMSIARDLRDRANRITALLEGK